MTDEEHGSLIEIQRQLAQLSDRVECQSQQVKEVHGFLYAPPFAGAKGPEANETMAQWLHRLRARLKAADMVTKMVMYLASAVTLIGGAVLMFKGWNK